MKHIVVLSIALTLTSTIVSAGAITDTYTAGDVLTAAKMDNIKAAVNDNNTNLTAFFSGDGSAGALTISSSTSWTSTPPTGNNLNFTNIVIDGGGTLTVPAGTTIRCSGTFTNNGTINIDTGASRNGYGFSAASTTNATYLGGITSTGHPGDTFGHSTSPGYDNNQQANPSTIDYGRGGTAIPQTVAASSFNSFKIGGGSGSGWSSNGSGGGLLKINCNEAIINAGTIYAVGGSSDTTSGGGGGGIVILASQTSVDNTTGTINANGGTGGISQTWAGPGGGGGGGIVIFIAPAINSAGGIIDISGGTQGATSSTTATLASVVGGGGGGASGGSGGDGGGISTSNTISDATAGSTGYVLEIAANPAYIK